MFFFEVGANLNEIGLNIRVVGRKTSKTAERNSRLIIPAFLDQPTRGLNKKRSRFNMQIGCNTIERTSGRKSIPEARTNAQMN